jgi:hypothetical protein
MNIRDIFISYGPHRQIYDGMFDIVRIVYIRRLTDEYMQIRKPPSFLFAFLDHPFKCVFVPPLPTHPSSLPATPDAAATYCPASSSLNIHQRLRLPPHPAAHVSPSMPASPSLHRQPRRPASPDAREPR